MRRLALILALVLLGGCGAGDDAPSGPQRSIPIGLAANVDGAADIAAEVEAVRRTRARWLREDLEWSVAQPRRGVFDWTRFDAIVLASARRGIQVLPILDSSPCWAVRRGTPAADCFKRLPLDDADFALFAQRAVARYGPGGSFWVQHRDLDRRYAIEWWEVWNEPYLPTGALPVSGARYAALFKAAADAGHAEAPQTKWLFAASATGTRPDGSEFGWLAAVADAAPRIAARIDALSIHAYPRAERGETLDASGGSAKVVAKFEDELGVARPVWITELGFAACDPDSGASPCVPGETRREREVNKAGLLSRAIDQFKRTAFTDAVFVYTLREYDRAFHGEVGLLAADGRPLPAYRAFRRAAK